MADERDAASDADDATSGLYSEASALHTAVLDAMREGASNEQIKEWSSEFGRLEEWFDRGSKLEIKIAFFVLRRARPAQAVRSMGRLRRVRAKQNADALFKAFETRIKDALGGRTVSSHGFDEPTFEHLDHGRMWSEVTQLIDVLRQEGCQVFLNSGTLLGVVREGGFLAHDDDVDLGVILPARDVHAAASAWKALAARLRELGIRKLDEDTGNTILKVQTEIGVTIDIFPGWVDADDRVIVYPHTAGELHVDEVLPLGQCAVTNLPVPAKPEKMLAVNYGPSWRIPDPYFRFPWFEQKKKFEVFRNALEHNPRAPAGSGVVLTYGTFDLFHVGHVRLLERLSKLGEKLIVGCSTDEFNALKGKAAAISYEERVETLLSCRYVDHVFPERHWDQKRLDVIEYEASLFAMGDDWSGKFDDLKDLCEVLYLPRTKDISATEIKSRIRSVQARTG